MILLDRSARSVIAHRGASGEFPENTFLAFRQALAQGADALELDLRATADETAVVLHDATVDRTTDGRGRVAAMTSQTIRALDAGRGEPVPTLDGVLEEFTDTPLLIEVKEIGVGEPAATAIARHRAERRVVVGSFVGQALVPFRRRGWSTSASRPETARRWVASRFTSVGWKGPFQAYAVPERYRGLTVVDGRFVRAARRAGIPVHVWTVNAPAAAERLWALGVSGIITNFPARIRALQPARR